MPGKMYSRFDFSKTYPWFDDDACNRNPDDGLGASSDDAKLKGENLTTGVTQQ